MVRKTNAVATHARKKRLLKAAKGFWGDRKNHLRTTLDAVMKALAYNYIHRKLKKREFRRMWITRISAAAKINGMSYNRLINGLKKAQCELDRKMLSEMAIHDPESFAALVDHAKQAVLS